MAENFPEGFEPIDFDEKPKDDDYTEEPEKEAPKQKGRPKGAKNKGKAVPLEDIPQEAIDFIAVMPLMMAQQIAGSRHVILKYPDGAPESCSKALKIWLEHQKVVMTPNKILLAAYAMAIGGGYLAGMEDTKKHRENLAKQAKAAQEKAQQQQRPLTDEERNAQAKDAKVVSIGNNTTKNG